MPQSFIANVENLKQRIADFRDYQIAHAKNPRTIRSTVWGADKQPRIAMTHLYPSVGEMNVGQKESESLDTLMQAIELHIGQVIELVVTNRSKSRYLLMP